MGLESTKQVLLTLQPVTNVNKNVPVPGDAGADLAQHVSFIYLWHTCTNWMTIKSFH